jgi:hypothetical protein
VRDRVARLAALAAIVAGAGRAAAEPVPEPGSPDAATLIAGKSACPEPAAVWAELGNLVPREHVGARLRALAAAGTPVEIVDLGATYRVLAAGRVREYRDDGRDCAHRARIAALFVALAVDPAAILTEPPAPVAPPPPAAPIAPAPTPEPLPRVPAVRVGLAATAEGGLGAHAELLQAGGWLRLAVGRGRWSLAAGAGLLAPASTRVGDVPVDAWRLPVDLGVRLALGGRRFERFAELGGSAAVSWLRGAELVSPRTATTLELGVHGTIGVVLATAGRVAPFAALRAELVPSPPTVFALPAGELGTLPLFRVGVAVGAELEFF